MIAEHGIDAVTAYVGNPLAHAFSLSRYIGILIGMSGIPMIYSPGTVDQWPKNVSSHLMYGGMWSIPVPDVRRTDLLVVMGANPHASQGSLLACPDLMGEIDAIQERGGEVIVIDPRRTGTADQASEWLPITPGTDAAFLLAVCHVLFADDLVDLGHGRRPDRRGRRAALSSWPTGRPSASRRPPASRAERTRRLAHQLAEAERGVLYGRIGLCNQEFGTLASWLVDVVNILTAHFDVPGGLMFPRAVGVAGDACCRCRASRAAHRTSAAGAAACAARPRCSATCRCRASPRRSRRRARARSARCSRSPATRCCRRPAATDSTTRSTASTA